MIELVLRAAGLGVAGIDPLGAILLSAAISAGASRTKIFIFAASVALSTVIAGTVLALSGNAIIDSTDTSTSGDPSGAWAYVEIAVAAVIVIWLLRRWLARDDLSPREPRAKLEGSSFAFAITGVVFSVSSVLDPTFLATAAIVGRSSNLATIAFSFAVWLVVSQIMLVALLVAFARGAHERLTATAKGWWGRHRTALRTALAVAAGLVATALTADGAYRLATGEWAFQGDRSAA